MKMKKTKMVKKKEEEEEEEEEEKKEYGLSELKRMGSELLSSKKHLNNLPILIGFLKPYSPPDYVLECLLSLQSFFTLMNPKSMKKNDGESVGAESAADADLVYERWIGSKYEDFIKGLLELIENENVSLIHQVVMDTIMEFVKIGGGDGNFNSSLFHSFLNTLIFQSKPNSSSTNTNMNMFASNYLQYIDVSYFTFISIHKIASTLLLHSPSSNELPIQNMLFLLLRIPPTHNKQMWTHNHQLLPAKKIKFKFTKAWISFLRLPLPLDVYKEVLVSLHQAVIPYISNPIMLCDFLTRSYDIGGVISVMALSGLYLLMTQHGLEYPNFYNKLYALLVPSVFIAKHRAKFFELLDSCLKSPLLPAYLAASFAKKLSRLSLPVPPSGGLVIVALIHNLLRRHPSINFLVHREDAQVTSNVDELSEGGNKSSGTGGIDHFNNEETDPLKTNAMRSSLWEIDTLRHHYCPPVSRFVLSLENDLTVRSKTTEVAVKDFSGGSYATIFGEEIRRRVKQVPLAFYKATPTCLFSEADFPGWSFKHEEDGNVAAKRQRIECA